MVDAGQNQAQYGLLPLEPDNYQRILHEIGLSGADALLVAIAKCMNDALAAELANGAQIARFPARIVFVVPPVVTTKSQQHWQNSCVPRLPHMCSRSMASPAH